MRLPIAASFVLVVMVLAYVVYDRSDVKSSSTVDATQESVSPVAEAPAATPAVASRPAPQRPPALAAEPATPKVKLRRKARAPQEVAPTVQQATGLKPVADEDVRPHEVVASANPARAPRAVANLSDPMKDRWIDELSGSKARIGLNKEAVDQRCGPKGCERVEGSRDAVIAGVVVKSQRLMDAPAAAVDGKVRRGGYVDATPAVYVE